MKELSKLEPKIKAIARRYAKDSFELEDLVQIGRIAIWKTSEINPSAPQNYLLQSAKWAIGREKQYQNVAKRGGKTQKIPFNSSSKRDFAPEDYISSAIQLTQMEMTEFLKYSLKEKFGRNYINKIKKEGPKSIPRRIVRGLVEEIWNFTPQEVTENVDYQLFVDSKMEPFLWAFYRNSPMKAMQDAYPGMFFEWEFKRVPNGFWNGEEGYRNAQDAVRWIAQKYDFKGGKQRISIGYNHFIRHGLGGMLNIHFNDSPMLALKSVFPEIDAWQTRQTPEGYFDKKANRKLAVESVLQDLNMVPFSHLTKEEVYDQGSRLIRQRHFNERGLRGLLERYDKKIYKMFREFYRSKIEPWFFSSIKSEWEDSEKISAKAIRWLFEDYLQIPKNEIPGYATQKFFWRVGFSGILTRRNLGLNSSPYAAVNLAYPGEFSPEDFNSKRHIKHMPGLKDFRGKYERKE